MKKVSNRKHKSYFNKEKTKYHRKMTRMIKTKIIKNSNKYNKINKQKYKIMKIKI